MKITPEPKEPPIDAETRSRIGRFIFDSRYHKLIGKGSAATRVQQLGFNAGLFGRKKIPHSKSGLLNGLWAHGYSLGRDRRLEIRKEQRERISQ